MTDKLGWPTYGRMMLIKIPSLQQRWSSRITKGGWNAWRYPDCPSDEINGIAWFDVQESGIVRIVTFYLGGHCFNLNAREDLPVMVAPVEINFTP